MVKERKSNIELLRIIMILMVTCHHYVVNSGIESLYTFDGKIGANMLFMQIFSSGGKIAINGFLLISGYFMCTSNTTLLKWLKLFFEIMFYNIVINSIFLIVGYTPLGTRTLLDGYFPLFDQLGAGKDSFISLFLFLLLVSPFINKLILTMSRREYRILLGVLLFFFTVISSFYMRKSVDGYWYFSNNWEGLGWFVTAYLMGGYIRLHLSKKWDTARTGLIMTVVSAILICTSIYVFDIIKIKEPTFFAATHWVFGCNKILAVLTAISLFILFKNLNIGHSRFINTVSSATFGVLLIHGNSDTMRHFLWVDVFQNTSWFNVSHIDIVLRAVCVVAIIYVCCVIIDLLRQKLIEAPLFRALGKIEFLTKPLYNKKENT